MATLSNATVLMRLIDITQQPFDPYNQTFTWLDNEGNFFTVRMLDLATFNSQNISLGLVYGSQLGLAALMLVTLVLLTAAAKRHSPIFRLNVLALIFDLLRGVCLTVWLGSMYNNPYAFFSDDNSRITPANIANSVAGELMHFLEVTTIMCSLVFQVHVIMSTTSSCQRTLVVVTSMAVAFLTITVELTSTAVACQNMVSLNAPTSFTLQQTLANIVSIMRLVAIAFFLVIFSTKLGIAIRQRYRLGHSKFGPMQMVFIGSLQSMILPMIFTIAQYNRNVDLGGLSLTVLVCQLPLTALWARTSLEDRVSMDQERRLKPKRFLVVEPDSDSKTSPMAAKGRHRSSVGSSQTPLPSAAKSMDGGYRLKDMSMINHSLATTTLGSMDVKVKMEERDMV